jgi:hypothetical protein
MRRFGFVLCGAVTAVLFAAEPVQLDYRVLATTRTSTMEKELNEAAGEGYVFGGVMGGETASGGEQVVVVMTRKLNTPAAGRRTYKLLATSRTSTMQKELDRAGAEGFDYCGQTVFKSAFGGREVSVILERDPASTHHKVEYKLLATSRTGTMEKELNQAGQAGFEFLNVVVGKTAFGGEEVVSILRRYPE